MLPVKLSTELADNRLNEVGTVAVVNKGIHHEAAVSSSWQNDVITNYLAKTFPQILKNCLLFTNFCLKNT